jgi:hypothetical protein
MLGGVPTRLLVLMLVLWGPVVVVGIVAWAAAAALVTSLRRAHRRVPSVADEAEAWLRAQGGGGGGSRRPAGHRRHRWNITRRQGVR